MAKMEFYIEDAPKFVAIVDDGAVPRAGEYVNIRGKTHVVHRVTWAVDNADGGSRRAALRANIVLSNTD